MSKGVFVMKSFKPIVTVFMAIAFSVVMVSFCGCSQEEQQQQSETNTASHVTDRSGQKIEASSITTSKDYSSSNSNEHALTADATSANYSNVKVSKTGGSSGDNADFCGQNAAMLASNGGSFSLNDIVVDTDGSYATGVFAYGENSAINISHSVINTNSRNSGGVMVTGGATLTATDVTAITSGDSSAPIRSDRGGGNLTVNGGYYKACGNGSPSIYSTANIVANGAYLESTTAEGVVVEGKNSVTLNDCQLIAANTKQNSSNSNVFKGIMIYQSMSGDAASGTSSFSATDGSITNANGDVFYITNTACNINLKNVSITNNDSSGNFLRAESAGWGNSGSNGGNANVFANKQTIDGNMIVDSSSTVNLYLADNSTFSGAINSSEQAGDVYVDIKEGSTWTLSADSHVSSLNCADGCINLNGHTLYVDGKAYSSGSSTGSAFDITSSSSSSGGMGGGAGGSTPPEKPKGEN